MLPSQVPMELAKQDARMEAMIVKVAETESELKQAKLELAWAKHAQERAEKAATRPYTAVVRCIQCFFFSRNIG